MGCTDGYIRYTHSFTKTDSQTESFPNYVKTEYGTQEHSSRTNIVQGTETDTLYNQTSFDGGGTPLTFLTNGDFNSEYYSSETTTYDLNNTFSSVAGSATTDTQQCFEEAGDGASATQTITATSSNYYSNKTQTASSTVPFCIDGTNTSTQSYEYTQQVYNTDSVIDGETYTAESYEGQAPPGGEFRTVTISEGYYNVNLTGDTWDGTPSGVYTKTGVNSTGSDIGYTTTFLTVYPTIAGATTITASASITRFTSQTFGPPTGDIFTDGNTLTDSQGTTILYSVGQNNEVTRVTFWPFDGTITSSDSSGAQVVFKATQSDDPFVGRTQQSQYFWPNTGAVGRTFGETNKYAVESTFSLNDTATSTRERFNLLSQDAPGWNVWAVTPVFPDAFFGFGNSANAKTRDLYATIITNTSGSSLSQINTASITTALKTGAIGRGGGSIFATGSCGFLVENDSSRTLAWDTTNPDFNTSSKLLATHATTYESVVDGTSQTLTSSETMAFLISCSGKLDSKNDYATIDESMQGPVYGISYLGQAHHKDDLDRERTVYFHPGEYSISKSEDGQTVAGTTFTNTRWYYSTIMPDGENWAIEKNDTPVFTDDNEGEPISSQYFKDWRWTWFNLPDSHYETS